MLKAAAPKVNAANKRMVEATNQYTADPASQARRRRRRRRRVGRDAARRQADPNDKTKQKELAQACQNMKDAVDEVTPPAAAWLFC